MSTLSTCHHYGIAQYQADLARVPAFTEAQAKRAAERMAQLQARPFEMDIDRWMCLHMPKSSWLTHEMSHITHTLERSP